MKRHRSISTLAIVVVLASLLVSAPAVASGTYRGRPSGPPASIDRSSYELGKKIYAGQFERSENPSAAEAQERDLASLQERLPIRARTGVDLPSLAGQLDDTQFAALRYFLMKRFKVE